MVIMWDMCCGIGEQMEWSDTDGRAAVMERVLSGEQPVPTAPEPTTPINPATGRQQPRKRTGLAPSRDLPPQAVFVHAGHRAPCVVDARWCHDDCDPWLLLSLSDDAANVEIGGGATLHVWRPLGLVRGDCAGWMDAVKLAACKAKEEEEQEAADEVAAGAGV